MAIKNTTIKVAFLLVASVVFMANRGGSPGTRTGSTTDGSTCASNGGCHAGKTVKNQDMLSTDIPSTGYVGGETYSVTVAATKSGISVWGFEMMAESSDGSGVGSFENNTDVNTKEDGLRATHKFASSSNADGQTWSVDWTAPSASTGDVKFFVAVLAANGNGKTGGDNAFIDTLVISESVINSISHINDININVYPNPTSDIVYIKGLNSHLAGISIFNNLGEEVMKSTYEGGLDVSPLPQGTYFLKIVEGSTVVTKTFVKL